MACTWFQEKVQKNLIQQGKEKDFPVVHTESRISTVCCYHSELDVTKRFGGEWIQTGFPGCL